MKFINIKKIFCSLFIFSLFSVSAISDDTKADINEHALNFYIGMFDFSDHNAKAATYGFEHQNENLYRETSIGTISPVSGAFITKDMAGYIYTGIQGDYKLGKFDFNPSFAPGLYSEGDGKDLHHIIEFKTELQLSMPLKNDGQFGFSYNHISNAGLGKNNPGANSYMFNFIKKF